MASKSAPESLFLDHSGRVVIPASLRRELNLKAGDRLVAWVEKGRLIVRPRAELLRDLRERFRRRPGEKSLTKTLRRTRDQEVAHDLES